MSVIEGMEFTRRIIRLEIYLSYTTRLAFYTITYLK